MAMWFIKNLDINQLVRNDWLVKFHESMCFFFILKDPFLITMASLAGPRDYTMATLAREQDLLS